MLERSFSTSRIIRTAIWATCAIVVFVAALEAAYALKHYWYWQNEQLTVRPQIAGVVYIRGRRTGGIQLRAAMVSSTVPPCASRPVIATSRKFGDFVAPELRKARSHVGNDNISLAICLTQGNTQIDSWVTNYRPGALPPILLMCEFPIEEGARSKAHACSNMP